MLLEEGEQEIQVLLLAGQSVCPLQYQDFEVRVGEQREQPRPVEVVSRPADILVDVDEMPVVDIGAASYPRLLRLQAGPLQAHLLEALPHVAHRPHPSRWADLGDAA